MDFSEKAAARSKYRSTQHLKRVHGGRGRGRGQHAPSEAHEPELESNYDRYSVSDEEEAAEGEVVRQSEGADLQQLLAESEQFYAQAHFRYRSFIETVDLEPPPVDVSAIEQELAIEPELLVQALARLPLSDFLGLEPQFLVGLEDQVLGSAGLPVSDPQATTCPQQQHQAGHTQQQSVPHQQPQQPQQQPEPQKLQRQQQQQLPAATKQQQRLATAPPPERLPISSSTSAGSKPISTEAPPPPPVAAAAVHDDNILEQLLEQSSSSSSSTAGHRQQHAATTSTSACTPVGSTVASAAQQQGINSSLSSNRAGSIPVTGSQQHVQPTAADGRLPGPGVATAKASAAEACTAGGAGAEGQKDHKVDESFGDSGISSRKGAQLTAVNNGTVAASRSNKKQSLEDWLDGL